MAVKNKSVILQRLYQHKNRKYMKKRFFYIALLALATVGILSISRCEKEENETEVEEKEICNESHCQAENPLTELEWLRNI